LTEINNNALYDYCCTLRKEGIKMGRKPKPPHLPRPKPPM